MGAYDGYAVKTGAPDAVGIDYLIGDPRLVGNGLGTRLIWEFCRDVVLDQYDDVTRILASPDHRNQPSLRALAKAGFIDGIWIDVPTEVDGRVTTEVVYTLGVPRIFGTSSGVIA